MTKEELKKLHEELKKELPPSKADILRKQIITEMKVKERTILSDVVVQKLKKLLKEENLPESLARVLSKLEISPKIEVTVPEIKIPEIKVPEAQEIKIPKIEVPQPVVNVPKAEITIKPPKVHVNIPRPNITVKPPEVKVTVPKIEIPPFPKEMTVKGFQEFTEAFFNLYKELDGKKLEMDYDRPMPVILQDGHGNPFQLKIPAFKGGGGGGGPSVISFKDKVPKGYQKLTVAGTAVGLTIPTDSDYAVLVCEDADIRWRDDKTDPTATDGMPLFANQPMALDGALLLSQFKAIKVSDNSVLSISYYKK